MTEQQRSDEQRDTPQAEEPPDEEQLEQEMRELEKDPPENLEDWPEGAAKYKTFGGPEGDHSYEEGPERKLGPSSLRRREDGSIEIEGEEVDNPDDYKRESIENPMSQTAGGDDVEDE